MSRTNKFDKKFPAHITSPDYNIIKEAFTKSDMTTATANKLLNMVKYTRAGTVKKSSIQNKYKLNRLVADYLRPIKKGQTVDTMNQLLNQGIADKRQNLINNDQVKLIMNNLSPTKNYFLRVKTPADEKYYTIGNRNGFSKLLNKEFIVSGEQSKASDEWTISNFNKITGYEIVEAQNPFDDADGDDIIYKKRRNVGKFKFTNTHPGVDLSDYQIYHEGESPDNKNCLIHSLEKAGVDKELINNLIIRFSDITATTASDICLKPFEYIKQRDYPIVAQIIKRKIRISAYEVKNIKQKRILEYGDDTENEPIELATYNNHMFLNNTTKYKKYAIIHYEEFKNKDDWFVYSSKKDKSRGELLTSLEVVKLLDINKYFKPLEHNIDLTDNITVFTSSDLLNNLEEDQKEFEYKEPKNYESQYFFADLENINNTESLSIPFLAGIIGEFEEKPYIATGKYCILDMLDYVVKRSKYKTNNILYFHNMKYDFSLMKTTITITNMCEKDGAIYSVDLIYKKIKITLKDSYKVFAGRLADFSEAFKLPDELKKKEAINYDYYNEKTILDETASIKVYSHGIKQSDKDLFLENVKPFMTDELKFKHMDYYRYYLKYDVLVLQAGMKAFNTVIKNTFGKPIYNFLTISSFADDYFKSRHVYDGIYETKSGLKKFLSKAVYGGRVNVCEQYKKQVIHKRINDFDGVSLYPSAIDRLCTEYGLPIGKAKRYAGDLNKDYYIVDIEITKINKKQQNPFIALKTDTSIKYINEIPEGGLIVCVDRFTLEDYIKFHDIEYKILDGVYYDEGFNTSFKCIKDVFNERLKQKALKTADGDILQNIYKLIMNAAYGKTLLKSSCEKDFIVNARDYNKYVYNNFNTIKYCKKLSKHQYLVTQYEPDASYNRAQCGIAILSMSKRIMNEVMDTASTNDINIYYQDTDSMHIDDDKINKLAELYDAKYNKCLVGKNLGQFHSDFKHQNGKAKDVVAVKSVFLGKKAYIDYLEGTLPDGSKEYCTHARLKGINEISLINVAKTYENDNMNDNIFNVYEDLANDSTIEFILNPDNKPSFKFTSEGVSKIETNTFKRNVSFISGEINDDENE